MIAYIYKIYAMIVAYAVQYNWMVLCIPVALTEIHLWREDQRAVRMLFHIALLHIDRTNNLYARDREWGKRGETDREKN